MRRNGLNCDYMRVLVLGALLTTAACKGRDRDHATDTAGVPAAATTPTDTNAATGTMSDTLGGAAAMGPVTDANILAMIGLSNAEEIAAGKVAQTKATDANVKAFANDMVKDHTTMQGQADKLSTKVNVKPQPPANANAEKQRSDNEVTQLKNAAKGAAFDRAYIDDQVTDHQKALDNLQRFQNEAQNAELKNLIQQAVPKVQQHLQRARDIQGKLTAA